MTIPAHRRRWDGEYMKLIGIATGVYEGNNYAKLIFTEPFNTGRGFGENAIISRADYNYVMLEVVPQAALLLGQPVRASYDRFGKCNSVVLDLPVDA